jgi:eukaryotic-like serine/threonine-protein kinase
MANKSGQQVGSYRLVKLLGKGGFAEVYLGQHVRVASKQAAVKILYLYDVDAQKFHEEAEITEQLVHPHIVRLLDFDLQEGTPFLVLDYAPGGSLRNRHPKGTQVPLDIVAAYLKEIVPALQYAHDRHILHRDIKPDNVLIGRHGELLLSDFGIAQLSHTGRTSLEASLGTGGTPFYMAPETFRGDPEKASDQYALAVVVYEWLCGLVPFSKGNFVQLGYQHTHEPVPPLRDKNPAVPFAVEQVILKALAKDPKDRYPEVKDFAENLVNAGITTQRKEPSGEPVPRSPAPNTLPDASQSEAWHMGNLSRRTVMAGLLGTAAIVLVGGGAAFVWQLDSQRSSVANSTTPTPTPTSTPLPLGTTILTYSGHTDAVKGVSWSPDGKLIASGSLDRTVRVWNSTTGKDVLLPPYQGHSKGVKTVAWSPDGKYIASGGLDGTVQIWNATTGSHIYTYTGHAPQAVRRVTWSPDSTRIASGAEDNTAKTANTVQVWDATTGSNVFSYQHRGGVLAVAWSPDGDYIASGSWGSDHTVQIWNVTSRSHVLTYLHHTSDVRALVWSPDSKRIASGSYDQTVQVWDATTGSNIVTCHVQSQVETLAWVPKGQRIASGSDNSIVQIWDAAHGSLVFRYTAHSSVVWTVAWSPDGKRIASGSNDMTVQVWQAK